jgi:tetratricopeptide (TPR) repeat protein
MSRATSLAKIRAQSRGRPKPAGGPREPFLAGWKLSVMLCVLLAGATTGLYSPVSGYPFIVLDDHDYVTANPHVHDGLTWSTVKWAFTSFTAANWHPLTWLSHALDYQLFALNPAGHHWDSVLIHALNAVILFLLLAWMAKRVGPSLLVAALFAVHPLNVESVAWVAERKNVLSTLFFLLAIAAYVWYARQPDLRRYLLVVALYAAGLMAKPMVITLPFVLLLLDYWPLGRMSGSAPSAVDAPQSAASRMAFEKIPLLALSAASALITLKAQRAGRAVRTLYQFSFASRLDNAIVAYGLYLWKMLWPARLSIAYPHAAAGLPSWQWVLSGIVLICITAFVVVRRDRRYLLVGWLWFLGTLVPVIGLVQVGDAAMADRYAYIPLIGIFIMIVWGIADVINARSIGAEWRVAISVLLVVVLGVLTHRQMSYWNSEYKLWAHSLEVTQENPFAHDALGAALMDPEVAMSQFDMNSFGSEEKRMQETRRHLEQALAMRRQLAQKNPSTYLPDMAVTLNNLGNLARMENKVEEARQYYEEVLQIHSRLAQQSLDPYPADRAMATINLGYLERSKVENDKAVSDFGVGLELYRQLAQQDPEQYLPNVAEALNSLAVTERDEKRMDEARRHYEEALRIRRQLTGQNRDANLPGLAMTLNDLGVLDGVQNRSEEARQHYEEALTLYRQLARQNSGAYTRYLAGALNNLAFLYGNQNRPQESRAYYEEALGFYRRLFQTDPNTYAGDVARVESSLHQVDKETGP